MVESTNALWCMVSVTSRSTYLTEKDHDNRDVNADVIRASGYSDRLSRIRIRVTVSNQAPLLQDTIEFLYTVLPKAECLSYHLIPSFREPSLGESSLFQEPPIMFPWLKKLAVYNNRHLDFAFDLRYAPRLQELAYCPKYEGSKLQLGTQCQLRRLTLKGAMDSAHAFEVLRSCPLLETLHIDMFIPVDTPLDMLVFPHLRHLVLYDPETGGEFNIPLKLIDAPNLESLGLFFYGQDFGGPLVHPGSLRYLSLDVCEWRQEQLHHLRSLLDSCVSLEKLSMVGECAGSGTRLWLSELLQSPDVLPNLRYLETDPFIGNEANVLDEAPVILDIRPGMTLVLPDDAHGEVYARKYPAYASRMKFGDEKAFPAILQHTAKWHQTEEGWCN